MDTASDPTVSDRIEAAETNVSPQKAQIFQIHKIDALPGLDRYKVH
jgi:hypothetical protein